MRFDHDAAAGRAGFFANSAMLALRDISKKSDKDLEKILNDPLASSDEKAEAFLEMTRRGKVRPWPAVPTSAAGSTLH